MILSDNETILDQLNNHAIAETIVSIIKDSKESVSIGVHGDWGAGKSSILAMVENILNPSDDNTPAPVQDGWEDWDDWNDLENIEEHDLNNDIDPVSGLITVRFNSWQYQGFEDAKIALMSAIVKALQKEAKSYYKKHPVEGGLEKLKKTCGTLWKNLDRLSLAKSVGKIGASLATGTVPLALVDLGFSYAKNVITDDEKRTELFDKAGELLKKSESTSYKEMAEFRGNYKVLFKSAHIQKLVVLLDDLDRCLPKVAIETLEAVRMFLSLENTAFIIAADDAMIRYSVKEYFPRVLEHEGENDDAKRKDAFSDFSDKYLEKLIQVPFHIPRIGISEAQLYVLLLMVESATGQSVNFKNLVGEVIKKLHTPWALEQVATEELQAALGEEYEKAVDNIKIAKNIDRILAENTAGNPRNIKRFVNMLLLRTQIAHNRGFKELKMDVLAKMMLAEQYNYDFYKAIASELRDDGTCLSFIPQEVKEKADDVEKDKKTSESTETEGKTSAKAAPKKKVVEKTTEPPKPVVKNESFGKMLEDTQVKKWMELEPSLSGVDLRPYFFACTELEDFFFTHQDERMRELVSIIRGGNMNVKNNKKKFEELDETEAVKLFRIVSQDAFTRDLSTTEAPKIIDGIRRYVEFRKELQIPLVNFLLTISVNTIGAWAVGDWDACIPKTCEARPKLMQFYKKIEENNQDPIIKLKAKQAQE